MIQRTNPPPKEVPLERGWMREGGKMATVNICEIPSLSTVDAHTYSPYILIKY